MTEAAASAKTDDARFALEPRYRAVAWVALLTSCALLITGAVSDGSGRWFGIIGGAVGFALVLAYFRSPVWKLAVVVGHDLRVVSGNNVRLALPWDDIKEVVTSDKDATAFVDGGTPDNSVLVPGPDAPAPYLIKDRKTLIDLIVARVEPDKVRRVDSLRDAVGAPKR